MPAEPRQPDVQSTMAGLDETLTFMRALWRLEHALERASKRMEDTLGVTGPQRLALRLIGVAPDIGPAELAGALHLHPSTITGVVQRLEASGLIERVQHASDGRRVHLRVTRAGARLNVPSAPGTVEHAVRNVLRRIAPRDRVATVGVLDRVTNELLGAAVQHLPAPRRKAARRTTRSKT